MASESSAVGPASTSAHVGVLDSKADGAGRANGDQARKAGKREEPVKGAGFGPAYTFMRFVGERSIAHFFRRVMVVGGEDVPQQGTFILCCTHFATLMDVAIISAKLPHRRPIHYWAKKGLYKRQPFRWILENSGNIQVDRKEKNNETLFAGTFQAMEAGEPIGLFPEGGSFTEHRLHAIKAGAAWAALEYAKHLVVRGAADPSDTRVLIVPAAINYTDKSRFRSEAIFEFGHAFTVDRYTHDFLQTALEGERRGQETTQGGAADDKHIGSNGGSTHLSVPPSTSALDSSTSGDEGGLRSVRPVQTVPSSVVAERASKAPSNSPTARAAVARLTERITEELYKMTIDAPDWTTWHSVKMTRELIWKRNGALPLRNLVPISNAIVAILNAPLPQAKVANETLCALQGLVCAASTDVHTLNVVARLFSLPRRAMQSLGPHDADFTLPSRRRAERAVPGILPAFLFLSRQVFTLAIRLPYALPLAVMYAPAYWIGWYLSKKYSSHEEESMSSSKSLCAFVIAGLTHIVLIVLVALPFLFTPIGWLLGLGLSILIEKAHVYLLDETYGCVKKLVAAWRILAAAVTVKVDSSQYGQLGAESKAVRLAVEVVKSQPGIQWSFVKALRSETQESKSTGSTGAPAAVAAASGPHDSTTQQPPIRPKIFNRSGRPACYRLMGVTRLVHAQAVQSLHDLLQEFEVLDRQADEEGDGAGDVDRNTIIQYRYLREQMQRSGVSVLPRARRYINLRRKA